MAKVATVLVVLVSMLANNARLWHCLSDTCYLTFKYFD